MAIRPLTRKALLSTQLCTARMNIWEGSVRSSKTVSSIIAWMRFVRQAPPGELLMVGKTERTLKRNVLDPILSMVGSKRAKYVIGAGEFHLAGRRIYVAGANDERAGDRIRGMSLAGAYGDELSVLPESFVKMLGTRLSDDESKLFGTTNPDTPTHWLHRDYLLKSSMHLRHDGSIVENHDVDTTVDLHRFSFGLDDNPHLPAHYVANLKREYTGLWYRRFILGHWVIAAGAVFDMWDPERHVVADLPPVSTWLADGIDYGTTNPTRGYRMGITAELRPRLVLAAEWAPPVGLHDSEQARRYHAWGQALRTQGIGDPEWVCVDPAAASFKVQLRSDGLTNVINAANDVLPSIRLACSLLATGKLVVHESCAELIKFIPSYSWDPEATKRGLDEPLKVDDHEVDAGLRYAPFTTQNLWRDLVPLAAPIPDPDDQIAA